MNLSLYLLTVLIWGTTWLALKLHLGEVAIPVSIVYRFGLAALVLFALLLLSRKLQVMNKRGHLICLAQGLCLFCVNFMCFLTASQWVTTGLIAVVFSTATLWNALNARIFFKQKIARNVLLHTPPPRKRCWGWGWHCSARCVFQPATCCPACNKRPASDP